ncbi:UNVERIFIED_CONTAM: serine/threonine-protein kinase HAL4/sat4 [Siphonaria sp. JEL0065]|nr:serine/threonine-protein kinase HAL4/sat4 [Siphonaria sp. JEL0065]
MDDHSKARPSLFKGLLKDKDVSLRKSEPTRPTNGIAAAATASTAPATARTSTTRSATTTSDSETSDTEHHGKSNIFKNIMLGKRRSNAAGLRSNSTSSSAPAKSSVIRDSHASLASLGASSLTTMATTPLTTNTTPSIPSLSSLHMSTSTVSVTSSSAATAIDRSNSESSMSEKYGTNMKQNPEKILGKGATAVVRLCSPVNSDKKFAVKEFRAKRKDEKQKEYVKKLIAEFCISSTLDNENVVKTLDLIQDEKKRWCVVMEYAEGGDLYAKISGGLLTDPDTIDCFFKQLLKGVTYLHSMGVAHRDLKPENLLLDASARILKITDFGVSEVFRAPFESLSRKAHGMCGSGPYIAPEEFIQKEYDSEAVDVWACGIIFYVMTYNSIPWKSASPSDARYKHYQEHRGNFWPLDRLPPPKRKVMYRILDPDVTKRTSMKEIMQDDWIKFISCCQTGMPLEAVAHSHKALLEKPPNSHA